MKINFFAVNNFRGISGGLENNKIIFEDTNTLFIYGQNNVGKSTYLKAYEHFYRDSKPILSDFYDSNQKNSIEFEIEVKLQELDKQRIEAKAPKQKDSYKQYLSNDTLRVKRTWELDGKQTLKPKNHTYNYTTSSYDDISYASIGLHTIFQSCMPKPIFIKAMPTEDEAKDILNDILKSMAENTLKTEDLVILEAAKAKIQELQEKMYNPELVAIYQDSVNSYFSQIFSDTQLTFKEVKDRLVWSENKLGKDFNIDFVKTNPDGTPNLNIPSSAGNVGHGTIRTAIFTLLLMKDVAEKFERQVGRKDYIVLFEEPELFLYPKIVRELRELIYKVSEDDLPYQVLCASHSPSMIDISKPKSSIIRLTKNEAGTKIHQINDEFLKNAKEVVTNEQLKQEMNEILRFNPYICESFYADEVLLIEGPTEEILARAYLQEIEVDKDLFILNTGTVNNIPFYQKILSKFNIKYHAVFDTDDTEILETDVNGNPLFAKNIQRSISDQFKKDELVGDVGLLRVHHTTFEPAHMSQELPEELRYSENLPRGGKPHNANMYWKNTLKPNMDHDKFGEVPFIKYLNEIIAH
ncbi:ATP-dependent endonuclease [Vibrio lentus]|nr:AAA family ATPase [Vibrio lentus]PMH98683.1 ATP-dependent endonuclease [Vibrio lentus]